MGLGEITLLSWYNYDPCLYILYLHRHKCLTLIQIIFILSDIVLVQHSPPLILCVMWGILVCHSSVLVQEEHVGKPRNL